MSDDYPITEQELVRLTAIRMTIDQAAQDPEWHTLSHRARVRHVLGWLVCDPYGHVDPHDFDQAVRSPAMVAVADQLLAEAADRRSQP